MMATRCSAWPPAPCRRRMTRWKWWRPNSWRGRSRTGYARPWHNGWSAAGGDRLGLPIRDIELEPDAEALVAVRLPRGAPATRQVVDEHQSALPSSSRPEPATSRATGTNRGAPERQSGDVFELTLAREAPELRPWVQLGQPMRSTFPRPCSGSSRSGWY